MTRTLIEWAERVWNPVRGCSRVSDGCRHCFAERQAGRFSGEGQPWNGFVRWQSQVSGLQYENRKAAGGADPVWTGRVELIPEKLAEPLRWKKPARVFVNSMSDLFHESLPDEAIDLVFAVMALAPQHTFIVLTKRAERMRRYVTGHRLSYEDFVSAAAVFVGPGCDADAVIDAAWARYRAGLSNLWLGVSVEDQPSADERIPHLLATPAVKRFVSYEPALGPVDFTGWFFAHYCDGGCDRYEGHAHDMAGIDWIIVGGESGPGARPCDVAWIRSAVEQCRDAGVPCFVKQLGAKPVVYYIEAARMIAAGYRVEWDDSGESISATVRLRSRNGGDPSEWPEDLRVRDWP